MPLTKRQAQVKFKEQDFKRKNVVYLDRFDCVAVYRAGKINKEDEAFDNLRYYEDPRPLTRFDKVLGPVHTNFDRMCAYGNHESTIQNY
ncbi:hypothetical protein FKG94_26720 [Exilibacterium tricleocarpae]|uniref:Uncharacterized protein n=1 Tax=Exilibacterium tricleocarpae TaxID=2591008 RepID=A0A545SNX9_9GAMM|nr:hypothetical protein [Exilibacterium tricleocarpae]TQV66692.1 hypothetical protein FKG94_26720 [Exilibacterium tricleocarpae]